MIEFENTLGFLKFLVCTASRASMDRTPVHYIYFKKYGRGWMLGVDLASLRRN